MANFKFSLYIGNASQKGCPIKLVVRKNNERKIIALNLYAHPHQIMQGEHLCKSMRGVKKQGNMTSMYMTGVFSKEDKRRELIDLFNKS